MAKQDELKNLIRGKGIEALSSSVEANTPAEQELLERNGPPPEYENKPFEPKFEIVEIIPEKDDLKAIAEITEGKENYFVVLQAYTCEGEILKPSVRIGEFICFKINCAAAKLPMQLEARYRIEIIAFDARTLRPETLYSHVEDQQLQSTYFQISYTTKASLKGLFKLRVILSIKQTDIFQVYEGDYFQVA